VAETLKVPAYIRLGSVQTVLVSGPALDKCLVAFKGNLFKDSLTSTKAPLQWLSDVGIIAFEESLRLNETARAYYNLALVYESVHRIDEAVREYKMAVELDPNYAPAAEALNRLQNEFAASHCAPEPAVAAAQPTQSMPAGPPPPSQTQSFAGPPPQGPTIGQAPPPLADPFARPAGAPPTQANVLTRQMAKEQAIADQHHALMRGGIIYGAICGRYSSSS